MRDEPERERVAAVKEQSPQELEQARLARERFEQGPIAPPPTDQERVRRDALEQAFGMMKDATRAAARGDCATAIDLGEKIRVTNMNVWSGWFLRDVQIKRCLDAAAAPQPVPPDAAPVPSDAAPTRSDPR
jgi:hypothetical protein